MNAEKLLKAFLRIIGTCGTAAVVAVVMPHAWMDMIHSSLGLGPLPDDPIVGYLARSTSVFYTFTGILMWFISLDLIYYRKLAVFLGYGILVLALRLPQTAAEQQ